MSLLAWFGSSQAPSSHSTRHGPKPAAERRRQQARQLFLEGLEVRSLLAFNVLAEYGVEAGPIDLALTPIDAGSQLDLVVASGAATSVGVRLGNADGTFGGAQSSATGSYPHRVAAGDFTGGGIPDVVTANSADLSLLVGKGDGTFEAAQSISLPGQVAPGNPDPTPLPQHPLSVATGDVNADGKLDLVVGTDTYFTQKWCYYGYWYGYYCGYYNVYDGYVNVLLGNGEGDFGAAETHHLGTSRFPNAVAVGDVNGDGKDDVITANGGDLSVLLNVADEPNELALSSPKHSGSGYALNSISLGDVDGDGKVDTLLGGGYGLIVQKGDGLGSFAPLPSVNTGNYVNSAVMGDVNADGKLDLVAAGATNVFTCTSYGYWGCYDGDYTTTRLATVLLGNGLGNFALPLTSSLGSELGYGWLPEVALADLTGDGLPELVTIDYYASTAIVATNDGDWNPPPSIAISDSAVVEGDGGTVNAVFTVTLLGEHDGGIRVDFATADSTARAGADYTATSGTLTFGLGEMSKEILVPILGDARDEDDEQFFASLFNAVGGQISDSQGTGVIEDNDPPPLVTINDMSKREGRRNMTSFAFTVTLSTASDRWVSVSFATANGTATLADGDYVDAGWTVSFAPGQTTQTVTVQVRGDRKREADETFFVNLTDATNGTIDDGQGIGTIVNDDRGKGHSGDSSTAVSDADLASEDAFVTTRKRR